jgi:hypothetical protein
MSELIVYYILGFLVTTNLLAIWFQSTIFWHIFSAIFGVRIDSFQGLIDEISDRSMFFGDLLSCVQCLGTWVSFGVSLIFAIYLDISLAFVIVSSFSWPYLAKRTLND